MRIVVVAVKVSGLFWLCHERSALLSVPCVIARAYFGGYGAVFSSVDVVVMAPVDLIRGIDQSLRETDVLSKRSRANYLAT